MANPYQQNVYQQNLGIGSDARMRQPQSSIQPPQQYPQQAQSSGGMTVSPSQDPFSAQPVYASSGGMSNPYLGAQAQAIIQQANQNLQNNLMPQVNSGAVAAGGYGGSRQGIAQGLAMGQTQQGIANSLANMYGTAYSHDQDLANQRDIAWWANDTAKQNAQIAANASMYGADKSSAASMYGADASKTASMYGSDKSAAASMYGADKSSAASMYGADKSSAASMYGADKSAAASMYGADKSAAASMYNADANKEIAAGNLGLGYYNAGNNFLLGMGNLGLGYQNSAQNYDLGLRNNDLGYANLDFNINNSNFNNQLNGANFGLNVYNALQNGNQLGLNSGTTIQNTPLSYYNQFANIANATGGLGGQSNTSGNSTATGNPYLGALGGAQLGNAIYNNLGFGGTSGGLTTQQAASFAATNPYGYSW